MTDLPALIAKLEAAEGPSRELDRAIARLVGWTTRPDGGPQPLPDWYPPGGGYENYIVPPRFTELIDAALALIPDGMDYVIRSLRGNAQARIGGAKADFIIKEGTHQIAAIALCIAALKARLAAENG